MTTLKEKTLSIIYETVKELKESEIKINSISELIKYVKKKAQAKGEENNLASDSAIRRYLKEEKFTKYPDGTFGFAHGTSSSFGSLVNERTFNNVLYFQVATPYLSSYIANELNRNFKSINLSKDCYCIALQDILICLFNDKQLTTDRIKTKFIRILKGYTLQTPAIKTK